ncbi:hypothetical protein ABTZ99_35695 [Actinosynnema sp. NPDC002837]
MTEYRGYAARQRFRSDVAQSPDGATVAYAADIDGQHHPHVAPVPGGPSSATSSTRWHAGMARPVGDASESRSA